jgi:hypothetical protein
MSTRSKVMGAGLASSLKNAGVSVNGNSYGGNKKQGLVSLVGLNNWSDRAVQINANGQNKSRQYVFCMNQLGGVGRARSQFNTGTSAAKPDPVQYKSLACKPPPPPNYY